MSDPTVETLQLLIEANDRRLNDLMAERDLRHQQRYEASSEALDSALGCAKDAITSRRQEDRESRMAGWRTPGN